MFTISQLLPIFFWSFVILVIFAIGAVIVSLFFRKAAEEEQEAFPYEKKPFVFDALSELTLYRALVELFGDTYYIFPQMVYSRLVQLKSGESLRYRTYFDKKIADFVLCDKEKAVAQLVIELDGSSHLSERKIERDEKVDKMMEQICLPILHLKTGNMDKEFIKGEVAKALAAR
jgi:very-short-patch-repair endonuclease